MNSKGAAPTKVYEDFVPTSKLVQEENFDTIHLNLPGFKKDQLKVVLISTGTLKISGERPIGPNKWQRFQKEFPVAENCDRTKMSAKLENGILHVKQPKLITSSVKKDEEQSSTLAENAPAAEKQKNPLRDEFSKQDNADIDTPAKEEPKKTSPKTSEHTEAKSLAEKKLASEEPKTTSPKTSKKTSPKTSEQTEAKSLAEKKLPSEESKKTSPKTSEQTEAKRLAEKKLPSEEQKKTSPKTSKKTSPKTSEQQEAKSLAEKELPADESSSSSSSSSESESDSTDDETDNEATGYASCLAAKLKKRKVALVGLLVLGISLYVAYERSH